MPDRFTPPVGGDKIVILGNGPSLRGLPFSQLAIPSMGMNAAYRAWDRFDWAPTYYLCLDHELIHSHVDYIAASARNQRFRGMFLAASILDDVPDLATIENVQFVDQYSDYWWRLNGARFDLPRLSSRFYDTAQAELLTTGSYAIRWAAQLGYRNIGLIGIDCRYEPLPEWTAGSASDIALKMAATPASNPNYFFDDYQQQGDRFNVPNPASHGINLHLEAVRQADLEVRATEPAVEVYNLAQTSQLHIGGALPFRLPEEFCALPGIGSVLVPMIEREIPAALANLKTWDTEAFRPSRRVGADKPTLIFCLNCEYVAEIEQLLVTAYHETSFVKAAFSDVVVHFCDLPPEKDLYVRVPSGDIPPYGFKSGPNWLFYHAMTFARDFGGYCLQIETDCRAMQPGWLDTLADLARANTDMIVLGSPYKGKGTVNQVFARHLNGNALYNVTSPRFWTWLDDILWPWLEAVSGTTMPSLAYDCAWEAFLRCDDLADEASPLWQKIRPLLDGFIPIQQMANIAGAAEIRGEFLWTSEDVYREFPLCVIAHGPVSFSNDSNQFTIKPLIIETYNDVVLIDNKSCQINDSIRHNSFFYINIKVIRSTFLPGDLISVSGELENNTGIQLQLQLVRGGNSPYEAEIYYPAVSLIHNNFSIEHKVVHKCATFRLQVGTMDVPSDEGRRDVGVRNIAINLTRGGKSIAVQQGFVAEPGKLDHDIPGFPTQMDGATSGRLLLIDPTLVSGGTATGELKAKFLHAIPDLPVLHVYWDHQKKRLGLGLIEQAKLTCATLPIDNVADRVVDLISTFDPTAVLYRPVEGNLEMSRFAERMLDAFPGRSAIWIMDDLESDRNNANPDGPATQALLHDAVGKATVRWAISDAMAQELERRHGHGFKVLRNGISAGGADVRITGKVHPDRALVVRYSGGMAPDMNSESLLAVARAVERLGGRARLEIATQPHWHKQQSHRYAAFDHSAIAVADRTIEEYEAWIAGADLLILAYNFDEVTRSYVRYSFANKYPELLHSGRPVLSVGPSTIATVRHVMEDGFATVIAEDSEAQIANAIAAVADSIHGWDGHAQRRFALARYGFDRELATFDEGLFDLYSR